MEWQTGQLWVACNVVPWLVTQNTDVLFPAPQNAFLKRTLESKDSNSSENSRKVGPASFPAPLPLFLPTSVLPPQEEEKSFMEMFFKNMAVSSEKLHTPKLKRMSHECKRVCMTGPRAIFNPLKPETHFTITFSSMKEGAILACSMLHKKRKYKNLSCN